MMTFPRQWRHPTNGSANAPAFTVAILAEALQNFPLKAVELQWQWPEYHLIK
jgi:hypothetical protein